MFPTSASYLDILSQQQTNDFTLWNTKDDFSSMSTVNFPYLCVK
jgi:hypothetical protein